MGYTGHTETTPEITRLTADVALFGRGPDGHLYALVIRRGEEPFTGLRALPGGHVEPGEDTEDAARRETEEETGIRLAALILVKSYAQHGRDPRGRYITYLYTTRVLEYLPQPTAGDDAAEAEWVLVDELLATGTVLAFDHKLLLHDALREAL